MPALLSLPSLPTTDELIDAVEAEMRFLLRIAFDPFELYMDKLLDLEVALVRGAVRGFQRAGVVVPKEMLQESFFALKEHPDTYIAGLIDGFGRAADEFISFAVDVLKALFKAWTSLPWLLYDFYVLLTDTKKQTAIKDRITGFLQKITDEDEVELFGTEAGYRVGLDVKVVLREDRPAELARWIGYGIGLIGFEIVMSAFVKGAQVILKRLGLFARASAAADRARDMRRKLEAMSRRQKKADALSRAKKADLDARKKKHKAEIAEQERLQFDAILQKALGANYQLLHRLYKRCPKLSLDEGTIRELAKVQNRLNKGRKSPALIARRQADASEFVVLIPLQNNKLVTKVRAVPSTNMRGKHTPDWGVTYKDGSKSNQLLVDDEVFIEVKTRTTGRRGQRDILDKKVDRKNDPQKVEKLDAISGVRGRVFDSDEVTKDLLAKIRHGQINPQRQGTLLLRIIPKTADDVFGLTQKQVKAIEAAAKKNGGVLEVLVMYDNKYYRVGKGASPVHFPVQGPIPIIG